MGYGHEVLMYRKSLAARSPQTVTKGLYVPPPIDNVIEIHTHRRFLRRKLAEAVVPSVKEPKLLKKRPDPEKQQELTIAKSGFTLRVLNQYVRCVLGLAGLDEYLNRAARNRVRAADRERRHLPFPDARSQELKLLLAQARGFVGSSKETGDCTRNGFSIRRGIGYRGRLVFLTFHAQQNRVVGIYTGAQFNRQRVNESRNAEAHHLAKVYRLNKSHISPR